LDQFGVQICSVRGELMPLELRVFLENLPDDTAKQIIVWLSCNPLAIDEMLALLVETHPVKSFHYRRLPLCIG
jgi:DNA-binding transcriptional ArsR family regulator